MTVCLEPMDVEHYAQDICCSIADIMVPTVPFFAISSIRVQ